MMKKKGTKSGLVRLVFGAFFLMIGLLTGVGGVMMGSELVYAEPEAGNSDEVDIETIERNAEENRGDGENGETEQTTETNEGDGTADADEGDGSGRATDGEEDADGDEEQASTGASTEDCKSSLGAIGWLVCPVTGKIAEAVDWLYDKIEDILIVNPIEMKDGTPIYEVWKYFRAVTNVVFIIIFLIVIYSQLTGFGISNYGVKKMLPKMIVVAILVNLSFLVCSVLVDTSNIVGGSLRGLFSSVEESTIAYGGIKAGTHFSLGDIFAAMTGGAAFGLIAFELGAIWMMIPTVLGAIVAVASGLITIALRQAVVALLIMISPLAFVAYMLPNTEGLFSKWKRLLTRMLVFYPMFSLLFGASQLAGFAIIASANSGFGVLLGIAIQIFPLFFSWKMMQMSGTFLGDINTRMRNLAAKPLATNRAWADSRRQLAHQKKLASGITPSARLMQFMNNRRVAREEEISELAESAKLRGQAYAANRNYRRNGLPSREGEEAYARQARNMGYQCRSCSRRRHCGDMKT